MQMCKFAQVWSALFREYDQHIIWVRSAYYITYYMSAICVTQSAGSDDPCIMTSSSLGGHLTGWGVRDWVGGHLVRWVRNWEVGDERWGWEAPKVIEWKDFSLFAACPFWRNPQEGQKVPSWQIGQGTCLKGSSCLQGTKQFPQPTCSFTFWVRLRTCLARVSCCSFAIVGPRPRCSYWDQAYLRLQNWTGETIS